MRKGNANIHNIGRLFSKLIFGAIYCRELLLFASDCRFHRLPVEDFGVFPPDQLRLSFDPYERTWYGGDTEEIRRRYGEGRGITSTTCPFYFFNLRTCAREKGIDSSRHEEFTLQIQMDGVIFKNEQRYVSESPVSDY